MTALRGLTLPAPLALADSSHAGVQADLPRPRARPRTAGLALKRRQLTLEGLLEAVREGRSVDQRERPEAPANASNASRKTAAGAARRYSRPPRRARAHQRAARGTYEENDLLIGELEERLQQRMGSLKELFGVLQQVASDAQAQFHVSLTELEHPDALTSSSTSPGAWARRTACRRSAR
jgi:hypothetical protein